MKLSTRLILLMLGCLLPILTAQIYSQINLYSERQQQLGALVLRQAELANADVASIIDGVHQLSILATQVPEIGQSGDKCDQRLEKLRSALPRYRFLAIVDPSNQTLLCASEEADIGLIKSRPRIPAWMAESAGGHDVSVGRAVFPKGVSDGIMPIPVRMPPLHVGEPGTVLIAGLSVKWLADHLRSAHTERSSTITGSELFVTDRDGVVIAHVGQGNLPAPTQLPAWISPVVARGSEGIATWKVPITRAISWATCRLQRNRRAWPSSSLAAAEGDRRSRSGELSGPHCYLHSRRASPYCSPGLRDAASSSNRRKP